MDFRFNQLRHVKKVQWKQKCDWWCEVTDGFSWYGHCLKKDCKVYKNLFVINRGFGLFKLDQELEGLCCPVCKKRKFELRNIGFVNCEWAIKGALNSSPDQKIFAEGQTFDDKLYTFTEANYKTSFSYLNVFVKKKTLNGFQNFANALSEEDSLDSSVSISEYGPESRRIEKNKNNKEGVLDVSDQSIYIKSGMLINVDKSQVSHNSAQSCYSVYRTVKCASESLKSNNCALSSFKFADD